MHEKSRACLLLPVATAHKEPSAAEHTSCMEYCPVPKHAGNCSMLPCIIATDNQMLGHELYHLIEKHVKHLHSGLSNFALQILM